MRRAPTSKVLAYLTLLAATLLPNPLSAQTCAPDHSGYARSYAGSIGFISISDGITNSDLGSAIGYWSGACSNDGTGFPSLHVGGSADVQIAVQLIDGRSTNQNGTCGEFRHQLNGNNQIVGGTIVIWSERSDGTLCQEHYVDVIAHEMGHVLGLDNATGSECVGHIMGAQNGIEPRTVSTEDCTQAGRGWQTPDETESCGGNCDDHGPCGV